jgi:hypothetical protein
MAQILPLEPVLKVPLSHGAIRRIFFYQYVSRRIVDHGEVGKGVLGNNLVRTVELGAGDPTVAAVAQEPAGVTHVSPHVTVRLSGVYSSVPGGL